jgi:hypothetical protein
MMAMWEILHQSNNWLGFGLPKKKRKKERKKEKRNTPKREDIVKTGMRHHLLSRTNE